MKGKPVWSLVFSACLFAGIGGCSKPLTEAEEKEANSLEIEVDVGGGGDTAPATDG